MPGAEGFSRCADQTSQLPLSSIERHRHVTADPIALLRYARYRMNRGLPQSRCKSVQLHDVRPCWKEGISPESENRSTALNVGGRGIPGVVSIAMNEILRVFCNPRMVERHM